MMCKQIELVCSLSKVGNNGLWVIYWEEMVKKMVICCLFKYLFVLIEIQCVVLMDEKELLIIDFVDFFVLIGEYSVIDNLEE